MRLMTKRGSEDEGDGIPTRMDQERDKGQKICNTEALYKRMKVLKKRTMCKTK